MSTQSYELNSQNNHCFGAKDEVSDLPDGIMSVAKCCQGSPLAVSSPHFLHADKWLVPNTFIFFFLDFFQHARSYYIYIF